MITTPDVYRSESSLANTNEWLFWTSFAQLYSKSKLLLVTEKINDQFGDNTKTGLAHYREGPQA